MYTEYANGCVGTEPYIAVENRIGVLALARMKYVVPALEFSSVLES